MDGSADPSLIVFCWGNESRGDDGIGPAVAARLRALGRADLTVIQDHQLNIEHVMDFRGATPLLFIDASVAIDEGVRLESLAPSEEGNFSTHAISPAALLNVYESSVGAAAPEAYLLHVAASNFELGSSLSESAAGSIEVAWRFLTGVLGRPREDWRDRLRSAAG